MLSKTWCFFLLIFFCSLVNIFLFFLPFFAFIPDHLVAADQHKFCGVCLFAGRSSSSFEVADCELHPKLQSQVCVCLVALIIVLISSSSGLDDQ